jgi:UDP:flavonoid glycosyltransferase YjiC (YdhE family)
MECIQTGKPVLAAPCFADQPMNAKLVEERKFETDFAT